MYFASTGPTSRRTCSTATHNRRSLNPLIARVSHPCRVLCDGVGFLTSWTNSRNDSTSFTLSRASPASRENSPFCNHSHRDDPDRPVPNQENLASQRTRSPTKFFRFQSFSFVYLRALCGLLISWILAFFGDVCFVNPCKRTIATTAHPTIFGTI